MSSSRPVLLDNTVLVNFGSAGAPELVTKLYGASAGTTAAVLNEYQIGVVRRGLPRESWGSLTIFDLTPAEQNLAASLTPKLGAGERSCLAVARERGGGFATDDLDARKAAAQLGVPTTGTLGILVQCARRGLLGCAEANHLLAAMRAAGFHSPLEAIDTLLE